MIDLVKEAEKIIDNVEVMELVDFEKETICFITPETPLFAIKHWIDANYYGVNLYAVINEKMILLETYDDKIDVTGEKLAENVIISIKDGFAVGGRYYVVPSN